MQPFMDNLNKISICNINKLYHKTIDNHNNLFTFVVCDLVETSSWDYVVFIIKLHIV